MMSRSPDATESHAVAISIALRATSSDNQSARHRLYNGDRVTGA